jgi:hypothetical protein
MRLIILAAIAFLCSACATVPPPATASGKPEVTIAEATPEKVKPVLVDKMLNSGFRITKDTPYELSFDKPVQNIAVAVLLGSKYDAQPNLRVSYTFAQLSTATRVVADVAIITNPGSAFEQRTDTNAGVDSHDIQILLETIRGDLDTSSPIATARRNKIVLGLGLMDAPRAKVAGMQGPDHGLYVVSVVSGGIADAAGITKGDVIFDFGGHRTDTIPNMASAQAATKPGSTVQLTVWRQGTEEQISIKFPATTPETPVKKKGKVKQTAL